jgi:hypothetical protein
MFIAIKQSGVQTADRYKMLPDGSQSPLAIAADLRGHRGNGRPRARDRATAGSGNPNGGLLMSGDSTLFATDDLDNYRRKDERVKNPD